MTLKSKFAIATAASALALSLLPGIAYGADSAIPTSEQPDSNTTSTSAPTTPDTSGLTITPSQASYAPGETVSIVVSDKNASYAGEIVVKAYRSDTHVHGYDQYQPPVNGLKWQPAPATKIAGKDLKLEWMLNNDVQEGGYHVGIFKDDKWIASNYFEVHKLEKAENAESSQGVYVAAVPFTNHGAPYHPGDVIPIRISKHLGGIAPYTGKFHIVLSYSGYEDDAGDTIIPTQEFHRSGPLSYNGVDDLFVSVKIPLDITKPAHAAQDVWISLQGEGNVALLHQARRISFEHFNFDSTAKVSSRIASLSPTSEQSFTAQGFHPDEEVTFTVHSDPVTVGTVKADELGAATIAWTVPRDFEIGEHTVIAFGKTSQKAAKGIFRVHKHLTIGDENTDPNTDVEKQPEPNTDKQTNPAPNTGTHKDPTQTDRSSTQKPVPNNGRAVQKTTSSTQSQKPAQRKAPAKGLASTGATGVAALSAVVGAAGLLALFSRRRHH